MRNTVWLLGGWTDHELLTRRPDRGEAGPGSWRTRRRPVYRTRRNTRRGRSRVIAGMRPFKGCNAFQRLVLRRILVGDGVEGPGEVLEAGMQTRGQGRGPPYLRYHVELSGKCLVWRVWAAGRTASSALGKVGKAIFGNMAGGRVGQSWWHRLTLRPLDPGSSPRESTLVRTPSLLEAVGDGSARLAWPMGVWASSRRARVLPADGFVLAAGPLDRWARAMRHTPQLAGRYERYLSSSTREADSTKPREGQLTPEARLG